MELELPPAVPLYLKNEWIEWTLSYPEGGSKKEETLWMLAHPLFTHKLLQEPKHLRRSLEEPKQPKLSADSHPFPPEPKGKSLKEEPKQPKLSADSQPFPPEPKGKSLKKESKQPKSADSAPSSLELRGMSQESPTPKEVRDHGRNGKDEPLWEEWERRALEVSPTPKSEVREPLSTWEEETKTPGEGTAPKRMTPGEKNAPKTKRKTPGVKKFPGEGNAPKTKRKTPGVKKVPKRKTPGVTHCIYFFVYLNEILVIV